MTTDDLAQIETSLGISLPSAYKQLVTAFPIPACRGNSDTDVWDDADALVRYNRELRAGAPGGVKPWPAHFFAIGRNVAGSSEALDLRNGDLWWADHSHLDNPGSYRHPEGFQAWAAQYFSDLRQDLAGEGIDPEGSPAQRAAIEERNAGEQRRVSLGCLAAFLVLVVVAVMVAVWLRR